MRGRWLTVLAIGVMAIGATALVAAPVEPPPAESSGVDTLVAIQPEVVHVDKWQLYRNSGGELFAQLCASCHGERGAGARPAVQVGGVIPPALDRLKSAGSSREHWAYVIQSPYEDGHHWGVHGAGTMPCWQRIFREATGSDAGARMVTAKLVDYLDGIQR